MTITEISYACSIDSESIVTKWPGHSVTIDSEAIIEVSGL